MTEHFTPSPDNDIAAPLYGVRPGTLAATLARFADAAEPARLQNFTAQAGQVLVLPEAALLGLGTAPVIHAYGAAALALPAGSLWHLVPGTEAPDDAALGFLLGAYRFSRFKSVALAPAARLAAADISARVRILADSITLVRDLINTPANLLGPRELAEAAQAVAVACAATAERVHGPALEARYPALSAVGAGSERAPQVVILRWQGSSASATAPLVSLCGKGVCFDTGGYDLKPSSAMFRMKKDMGGAAIMLGVARAIMLLNLPLKLELRLGCVENSVSGHAMRPSDVLRTRAGLHVEVGNTDAEGRLVLCDLLTEAAAESPDWLIDAATLTGAARVALGPDLPALFCTDDEMARILLDSGTSAADPLWRLPLHDAYSTWLDSPIADLSNVSAKPYAGAIVAALFLHKFIDKSINWAHIDVYAWNDSTRPGRPEGGEAQSLRAVLGAIEQLATQPGR